MEVVYLISERFDYGKTIAGDCGAAFAEDYGWRTATLSSIADTACNIAVVDQRIVPEELNALRMAINDTQLIFVLRLCDPIWEYSRGHWWYQFVAEMLDHPRVHVMLNYQPAEITALLASQARRSQFIFAPYVYRPELELSIEHEKREHVLFISGARDANIYPLRSRISRIAQVWPPLRFMTQSLPHPGYPDLGRDGLRHDITAEKYVSLLSTFRFAAVCSSRCRVEVMKYREFAYAGVVPVGDLPATLLDCPDDAWIAWRGNFIALSEALRTMTDTEARAESFRRFMRGRRSAEALRSWVTEQLRRLG